MKTSVDGLLVVAYKGPAFDKTVAAARLIREFDPLRFRRIVRDLENVWVWLSVGSFAHFRPDSWTCMLDDRFVADENTSVERIACTIVHEATHARLFRMGFAYDEPMRARVEKICVRREGAFARRLPNGGESVGDAEHIVRTLPELDLSNNGLNSRYTANARAELLRLGMPAWLVNSLDRYAAWRQRRRPRKKSLTDDTPAS